MLQIISGRFFGHGPVEERESDAILYSNLGWFAPISTAVMELRPADGLRTLEISSYVVRYTNRYERKPEHAMVLASAEEAVDQFRLLVAFWFRTIFHVDRQRVEHLCRGRSRHALDDMLPCKFLPRFFDGVVRANAEEVQAFPAFLAKVLAMPRQRYRLTIACMRGFFDALEAIDTNFDLAYSMLVYVLEALCQTTDGFIPKWEDYDPNVRSRLDPVLAELNPDQSEQVRAALLRATHLKLTKRFLDFTDGHVGETFFTSEAETIPTALPKSLLLRALRNAYAARSGFVHQLERVREQLRVPQMAGPTRDFLVWEQEPYLTFSGLVRLTRHVLATFIDRQEATEREDYPNWRHEVPGLLRVQFAPQYWIWQSEGFTPQQAPRRLGSFVEHILSNPQTVPDMSQLMLRIEYLLPKASDRERPALACLYCVYHMITSDTQSGWRELLDEYGDVFEKCCIETLVSWLVLHDSEMPWPVGDCVAVVENYLADRRFRSDCMQVPPVADSAMSAAIANLYLKEGALVNFDLWLGRAVVDAAGRKAVQDHLRTSRESKQPVSVPFVIGIWSGPNRAK